MSFTHPAMLLLLVFPIALLVRVWRHDNNRVVLPWDHAPRRRSHWMRFPIGLAECLPALVLAVVILLLAGPQQLGQPQTRRAMTNIEFCVDVSGSMTASFGEGTRYDASMAAINEFLDYRQGDAFGLTFFGNNVLHWVPLTSDPSAIRCSPPFMRPEVVPPWFGGTMIGKALLACRQVLTSREEGDRMVILVSDGESFDLGNGNDEELAALFVADNITIYAVHIGGDEAPESIMNITGLTGGEVFEPGDRAGLEAVFRRIDSMQQTKLEKVEAESMDDFAPYALVGLSLLGAGTLSLFGLRYTPW